MPIASVEQGARSARRADIEITLEKQMEEAPSMSTRVPGDVAFARGVEQLAVVVARSRPSIISVDFFDTLVTRDCISPDIIHERVQRSDTGHEAGLTDGWSAQRKHHEYLLAKSSPWGETTLDAVYDSIASLNHWPSTIRDAVQNAEIREELSSWVPNSRLIEFLRSQMDAGRRVIVTSDTILPSDVLRRSVQVAAMGAEAIMTSSESRATKRSGRAFRELKKRYPGERILHIGDSHSSDGRRAVQARVTGVILQGPGHLSSTLPSETVALARHWGQDRVPDWLNDLVDDGLPSSVAALAFSWSQVCITFVSAVRAHADEIGADAIWYTSRDCETLIQALHDSDAIASQPPSSYVYFSRAALRPLLVTTEGDAEAARLVDAYVAQLLAGSASGTPGRVLIVDVGWSGTLQQVLGKLRPDIDWRGYYLAVAPGSAVAKHRLAVGMVPWDLGKLSRAMTEMLFGFLGATCVGYREGREGVIEPVLLNNDLDRSDSEYVDVLRRLLTEAFSQFGTRPEHDPATREHCARLVERLQVYPRHTEVRDLVHWSVGSDTLGANASPVVGSDAPILDVVLGKGGPNNIWPSGAIALRIRSRYLAYGLQKAAAKFRSWSSR